MELSFMRGITVVIMGRLGKGLESKSTTIGKPHVLTCTLQPIDKSSTTISGLSNTDWHQVRFWGK